MESVGERGNQSSRPPVAVLVPFAGDVEAAGRTLAAFGELELGPGDELIVADNSPEGVFAGLADGDTRLRIIRADAQRSSYYARNAAADASTCEWLLFIDADCIPPADLLDRYFARPISPACGLLAGGVEGDPAQTAAVARWSRSRLLHRPDQLSALHARPVTGTGNALVRRAAWQQVGGFQEGIRSGGDIDFSWRIQDAGWELVIAEDAAARHPDWEDLRSLARAELRYGAGRAWINRHRPGTTPRPRAARGLLRCLVAAPVLALIGRFERARFKLIDAVAISCTAAGYLLSNRASRDPGRAGHSETGPATAILAEIFPSLPETFVAAEAQALRAAGMPIRMEAVLRPERPSRAAAAGLDVGYIEDEGYLKRIGALLGLVLRHPIRAVGDMLGSRRWPGSERVPLVSLAPMIRRLEVWGARHLHAHFAAGAAVSAARAARLLGVSYSVTAHAYEIFRSPDQLRRKLSGAAFVTTGCEYNVNYLREHVIDGRVPLHEIVMGTDLEAFRRRRPYPGGRRVLAVGRLVPKKGFDVLVEATALLEDQQVLDEVTIIGEGPEREALERLIAERGIESRIRLTGAREPEEIRQELERADLLAMPCVVAPDGDRDSMPVVVKEALAMEVPVVASDEVGLPELIRPSFGRLVPPGDPAALAHGIAELLDLSADERAEMGAAGRAWVAEHGNVERESRKLAQLITAAAGA